MCGDTWRAMMRKTYPELAELLIEGRRSLGLSQTELAAKLNVKQQAVSRWEAGTHRPEVDQLPVIAGLFDVDGNTLMTLAGYGQPVASSLNTLLPVDALLPETFERFVEALVAALEPEADINLLGSRGHTQKGSDIIAQFTNGQRWSFQCKRVDRFGIADIEKAIAKHSLDASRKFLVLSKIASPGAIETVTAHPGWTLWDKQVLTRQFRSLPMEAQERLVDIFFRGQRMALLGRSEPGPWLTTGDYFSPFEGRSAIFTHDRKFVGREADLEALERALTSGPVTLLLGPGGIGKTRIIKEAIERFQTKQPDVQVRFLSLSQEPDAASLAAFGPGPKLLVVDDAHDREGLKLLIEHCVLEQNRTKLLIASRPYAEQRIRSELGLYRIVKPHTVTLGPLSKNELSTLVVDVLRECDGNAEWADRIIAAASDSPLVAAMAARVVAVEGQNPELALGETKLHQFILSRFTHVIAGHLGTSSDVSLVRGVLEVVALIQPFHIDDRRVAELVEQVRPGIDKDDVGRALRLLLEGGVLYKRGVLYRLMPDLLGDFLIEEACIHPGGKLADFAIQVAKQVEGDRLAQVLVNLGRMDWRLADGDPSNSKLLEPIWRWLLEIDNRYDARLSAVEAVAYYQPGQALEFVHAQIDRDRIFPEFGGILKHIAYNPAYRHKALKLLWDLGQADQRDLNPYPGHPIRILADLVSYDGEKPLSFCQDVAEFGFGLLDRTDAWSGRYTPFDVLKPLLKGEGTTTEWTGRGVVLSSFFVIYEAVAEFRARLIDRILDLLKDTDSRAALHAARMVNDALSPPHGMFSRAVPSNLHDKYEIEFASTIDRIGKIIDHGTLAPTTVIGLIRSLEWYAERGNDPIKTQVRAIFARLPNDLDFRFHAALADGAEWTYVGQVPFAQWRDDQSWRAGLTCELLDAYPDRTMLCDALIARLDAIEAAGMSIFPAAEFVGGMINCDPVIGTVIIERSLAEPTNRLVSFLNHAVNALLEKTPEAGRALMEQMLNSSERSIRRGGAGGLLWLNRPRELADIDLLRKVLASADTVVVAIGIRTIRSWRDLSPREGIPLLLSVDTADDGRLFEDIAAVISHQYENELDKMPPNEVKDLLDRLKRIPSLEGYGTFKLLGSFIKRHGLAVAQMLLDRIDIELAKKEGDEFRAATFFTNGGSLRLDESAEIAKILDLVWSWLRGHEGIWPSARYVMSESIAAMFKLDSAPIIDFFDVQLDQATSTDLEWMARILRHADYRFFFSQHRFIERFLTRCKAFEPRLVKLAIDQLSAAAVTGSFSGRVGEPTLRDVESRDEADRILKSMSRLSPAYTLYRNILAEATQNIERTLAKAADLDSEE